MNTPAKLSDKLGICQWFHFREYGDVEQAIELMGELGVRHLRTGISWADYLREGGEAWYDWQMSRLAAAGLEVLLSVWHTPPSLAERGKCSSPPRRLRDYADFIDHLITRHGGQFGALEIWNEPNNRLKWNFAEEDPEWRKFAEMAGAAAYWARQRGRRTVLGGIIPVDHHWIELMRGHGLLDQIDVVAIHAFPGMWTGQGTINWEWKSHWHGWEEKVRYIRPHIGGRQLWVTETGRATWDIDRQCVAGEAEQVRALERAAAAPVERLYWYSLVDLPPTRAAIEQTEGDWIDPFEYHMGLVTHEGRRKPAFETMRRLLAGDPVDAEADRPPLDGRAARR